MQTGPAIQLNRLKNSDSPEFWRSGSAAPETLSLHLFADWQNRVMRNASGGKFGGNAEA